MRLRWSRRAVWNSRSAHAVRYRGVESVPALRQAANAARGLTAYRTKYPDPVLLLHSVVVGDLASQQSSGARTKVLVHDPALIQRRLNGPPQPSRRRFPNERCVFLNPAQSRQTDQVSLGRTQASDLVINDYTVSTHHAIIHLISGLPQVFVEDRGSTNGTWVDGMAVPSGEKALLPSGGELQVGRIVMIYLTPGDFFKFLTPEAA